jgi:pimeloyl-ACP methyl ester carboxylesterase
MTDADRAGNAGDGRHIRHAGIRVTYTVDGMGPPLVLVHGSFSDHHSNWVLVRDLLAPHFTLHAIARRGRGDTDATRDHTVADEARDVAAVIEAIGERVFLLGHSYGGQVALHAAALVPDRVRKLVLYEPPWPETGQTAWPILERTAAAGDWDGFATHFFRQGIEVPPEEVEELRASDLWPPIVADAPASLHDVRANFRNPFDPARFRSLEVPTLLQFGTHSPRNLFVTDALSNHLPDARLEELKGQGHDAMTTDPAQYAQSVRRFLLH